MILLDQAVERLRMELPLNTKQVALITGLSVSTVRNLINSGHLQSVRLSNHRIAISANTVNEYLEMGIA